MRYSNRLLASAGLVALATTGNSAFANQQPAPQEQASRDYGLEDIIVTARRVSENLQDVPVAITAFTGEDLEKQNVQQVADLGRFTPGMRIGQGSSTNSAVVISLRGQVQYDILATLDPSVGTYVDGVYWARAYGMNSSMMDMQSVQVLKGPQGTLFGRNTTGGALLLQTNDPDPSDASGMASVGYGRFDEWNLNAVLNIPLVEDTVALRVAGSRQNRDGYTNNIVTGSKVDERDRYNLRAKLLVKPSERLSLLFSGELYKSDELSFGRVFTGYTTGYGGNADGYGTIGGTAGLFRAIVETCANPAAPACGALNDALVLVNRPPPLPDSPDFPAFLAAAGLVGAANAAGVASGNAFAAELGKNKNNIASFYDPYSIAKTQTFGFTGTLDTDVGEIKLIAGYRKVQSQAGVDLASDALPTHFTAGSQDLKQTSVELQWSGKTFDDNLSFVLGGFVFDESGSDDSISIQLPGLAPFTNHFWGYIDNKSVGVYAQGTYKFNDQFSVTGGLRWSEDTKGLESRSNQYYPDAIPLAGILDNETICTLVDERDVLAAPSRTLPNGVVLGVGEVIGPDLCAISRKAKYSAVSYTIGAEYRPSDDFMIYVRHAKGFRAGGQNLRATELDTFVPFKPETAYSYEIGFKSEFWDRRVRLNVAAYQTDIKDKQGSTLIAGDSGATATFLGNAGKARYRGVEADVTVAITPEFRVAASGSLVDPKYLRYSDDTGDRTRERFVAVTKSQWAVAGDYSKNFGDIGLNLHVDYSWAGKTPFSEYNATANPANDAIIKATTVPATGLLGARAGLTFKDGAYELAVYGRNIANNRNAASGLAVLPIGYIGITRQEPATYGVVGTVRF